jgi:8-oxo-dGTP diphosphatase
MEYRYCPHCGNPLQEKKRGEARRMFCASCYTIHYRNPTVGVAVILLQADRILLVKRSGSYEGMWCIPCGHVEWDEDIRVAGIREFKEETNLDIEMGPVFTAHSNFHDRSKQTVGVWFWARGSSGILQPGSDASDAKFFPLHELPNPMAFPTDLLVCEQLRCSLATDSLPI